MTTSNAQQQLPAMALDLIQPRLPSLHQVIIFEDQHHLYDVRFFPYGEEDDDPVFAVTGARDTIVYKIVGGPHGTVERLRWFVDEEETDPGLCTLAWTMDVETAEPLLCISGKDARIKVLNIVTGKLVKTLHGHGHQVNDIVTSPLNSSIIASGSEDNSIRIWHMHPKFAHQPVAGVLAGVGGHENGLLKMAFHSNGRYLLSGGYDTAICLWVLPEYPDSPDSPYGFAGVDTTTTTHFPHFCSTAIHFHYVDSLAFHNDLILSKSVHEVDPEAERPIYNTILLWKITGFNSRRPIPPMDQAPANMPRGVNTTVSAWSDTSTGFGGFQVLMAFEVPGTEAIFMRFGLFTPTAQDMANRAAGDIAAKPQASPTLIMGSHKYDRLKGAKSSGTFKIKSRMYLWDLDLLADGIIGQGAMEITSPAGVSFRIIEEKEGVTRKNSKKRKSLMHASAVPSRLSVGARTREASIASSEVSGVTEDTVMGGTGEESVVGAADKAKEKEKEKDKDKETRWGPYTPQKPHKTIEVGSTFKVPDFTPRSAAWSMDGRICVVVGDDRPAIWVLGRE